MKRNISIIAFAAAPALAYCAALGCAGGVAAKAARANGGYPVVDWRSIA